MSYYPVIDLKDCAFFLIDGTGTNYILIRVGEGNLTYSVKRNIEQRMIRGQLWETREADQIPTDIAFQFRWDYIHGSSGDPPTIEDAFYNEGEASSWTSATSDTNSPFCLNLQIVHSKVCIKPNGMTVNTSETHNFPEFNFTELNHSVKDGTVDVKGVSNRVRPNLIRVPS